MRTQMARPLDMETEGKENRKRGKKNANILVLRISFFGPSVVLCWHQHHFYQLSIYDSLLYEGESKRET